MYNYLDHFNLDRLDAPRHRPSSAGHGGDPLSDGPAGTKWMEVGKANARFFDHTGNRNDTVTTNEWGWGEFPVGGGSVSVWVQEEIVPNQVSVYFTCNNGYTVTGQDVYVVGSLNELGAWDTAKAVKLSPVNYPSWSDSIGNLPSNTQVQWKCIKKQGTSVWHLLAGRCCRRALLHSERKGQSHHALQSR